MFSLPTHQQLDLKFLTLKLCCIEISTFLSVLPITPSNNNIRCKEKSTIIAELLSRHTNPLKKAPAYVIVKKTFVSPEDVYGKLIVVQRGSSRGIHFRGAGPREKVFTISLHYTAVIVLK
nr:ATP-dependent 6-phosphofructokinase 4, chloroplastic [Ipomoea batatas]